MSVTFVLILVSALIACQDRSEPNDGSAESRTGVSDTFASVSSTVSTLGSLIPSGPGSGTSSLFGGELIVGDVDPLTLPGVLGTHPGLLRHQIDTEGPVTDIDAEGIAVIDPSPWPDLDQSRMLRHPTVIARVAGGVFTDLLQAPDEKELIAKHLTQARWLRDNLVWVTDDVANWELPMTLQDFEVGPGWRSAMTNGFGLVALIQAASLSPREEAQSFVDAANAVLNSFFAEVGDGGVSRPLLDGSVCLEEVVVPLRPGCVLNGHVFAIAALDVAASSGSLAAGRLRDRAIAYVRDHISLYDHGFASGYALEGKYAEPGGYNAIHVELLLWLYHLRPDAVFLDTAANWLNHEPDAYFTVTASDSIDPEAHGPEVLSDGGTWYGYWSTSSPSAEVTFDFHETRDVCGVSLFALSEESLPFQSALIRVGDMSMTLDPSAEVAVNVNEAGTTLAVFYPIDPCVEALAATIEFSMPAGQILALREIDIHVDRHVEATRRLGELAALFDRGRPESDGRSRRSPRRGSPRAR